MWYLILLFIIIALPDFYIWWCYIKKKKAIFTILYWLPLVILIASIIMGLHGVWTYYTLRIFFVLFICVAIPKLLFALISYIGKLLSKIMPKANIVRNSLAFAIAIIALCCALYGFTYGWKKLEVVEQIVQSSDIPEAFNDYRIIQLSD